MLHNLDKLRTSDLSAARIADLFETLLKASDNGPARLTLDYMPLPPPPPGTLVPRIHLEIYEVPNDADSSHDERG